MHLVGFIIKIYHDARSHERQIRKTCTTVVSTKIQMTLDTGFSTRCLVAVAACSESVVGITVTCNEVSFLDHIYRLW
jgi:hypothetical protein